MIVLYQKRIRKSSNFLKMISFDSQFSTCSVYCRHYFISYYEGKIILYTTATASRCTITSRIPASYMVSSGAQLIQYILQLYICPIFAKQGFLTRTASHRREAVRIRKPWLAKMNMLLFSRYASYKCKNVTHLKYKLIFSNKINYCC